MNTLSVNSASDFAKIKVKDLVTENFHTAELFERLGIDFCCKGNRPLLEALEEKRISNAKFLEELNKVNQSISADTQRYSEWDLNFLAQYIVNNHHSYVKNSIPIITAHIEKVINAHGKKYSYIIDVQKEFSLVANDMINHMAKEEKILFPLIRYLVDTKNFGEKPKNAGYGTIQNPIRQMEAEHISAGGAMEKIKELTSNYSLPDDACTTFRVTFEELNEFEADLHKHVHLENNILFPRAIELEQSLMTDNK